MNTTRVPQDGVPPSTTALLRTTAIALIVAGVLLVTAVLPAEYGIDPLGVGARLGLTAISAPPAAAQLPPALLTTSLIPVQEGPVGHFRSKYRTEAITLTIPPYQFVEYKYRLEKGATMVYTWTAKGTMASYDFHAEPDGNPRPDAVSYDKQLKSQAHGSFTAPFSGIHGWYWENAAAEPLTIMLTTAGFYSQATEFLPNGTSRSHEPARVGPTPTP